MNMLWTKTNSTSNLKSERVFREYLTVLYLFYIKMNDTCQYDLVSYRNNTETEACCEGNNCICVSYRSSKRYCN